MFEWKSNPLVTDKTLLCYGHPVGSVFQDLKSLEDKRWRGELLIFTRGGNKERHESEEAAKKAVEKLVFGVIKKLYAALPDEEKNND